MPFVPPDLLVSANQRKPWVVMKTKYIAETIGVRR
jgi:hypothetical protein